MDILVYKSEVGSLQVVRVTISIDKDGIDCVDTPVVICETKLAKCTFLYIYAVSQPLLNFF